MGPWKSEIQLKCRKKGEFHLSKVFNFINYGRLNWPLFGSIYVIKWLVWHLLHPVWCVMRMWFLSAADTTIKSIAQTDRWRKTSATWFNLVEATFSYFPSFLPPFLHSLKSTFFPSFRWITWFPVSGQTVFSILIVQKPKSLLPIGPIGQCVYIKFFNLITVYVHFSWFDGWFCKQVFYKLAQKLMNQIQLNLSSFD